MTSVNGYILCEPATSAKAEVARGLAGLKAKNGLVVLKVLARAIHGKGIYEPGTVLLVKTDTYDREIAPSKQFHELLKGPKVDHLDGRVTGGEPLDFVVVHETHVIAVA